MHPSIVLELTRQLLRWLSVYLLGFGLPPGLVGIVEHPEFVAQIAAAISLGLADGGWLVVKAKQLRLWWSLYRWGRT